MPQLPLTCISTSPVILCYSTAGPQVLERTRTRPPVSSLALVIKRLLIAYAVSIDVEDCLAHNLCFVPNNDDHVNGSLRQHAHNGYGLILRTEAYVSPRRLVNSGEIERPNASHNDHSNHTPGRVTQSHSAHFPQPGAHVVVPGSLLLPTDSSWIV